MYDDILYQVDDPVALITLNRPASLNAWTDTMDGEMRDAITRALADRSVVGIVVTGAGRAFCAGGDVKSLGDVSGVDGDLASAIPEPSRWTPEVGDFGGRFSYLMRAEKPIIAAINGAVAGMAFPLSLCCDLRVVTPDAVFVTAFVQRGLIAEWGLSWLLPRLVGPAVALDLLLSSRKVRAEEAMQLGLANHLVGPDELLPYCADYVEQLARGSSPSSMAAIKRQVYEHFHRGLGSAERDAERLTLDSIRGPDFLEGIQSFLEKRPPAFRRIGN